MRTDIGVDIGGTAIKLGLVDERGRVERRCLLATRAERGPRQALERISRQVSRLRSGRRVHSVGVGIAGLVDHVRGVVRVPPNLPGWNGTPVKDQLEKLVGLPVCCGNDVNAVALGEWHYGAGQGCRNLFCVTLGTGVGGGIIADGKLLLGANHAAAEVGHTTVVPNGPQCRCGNQGCVERFVGAAYLVARARARLRVQLKSSNVHRNQTTFFPGVQHARPSLILDLVAGDLAAVTPREIGRAARRGDRLALLLVEEAGHFLGVALANVVQLLDPERVIIGGGMARLGAPLLKAVRRTVLARVPAFPGRRTDILLSRLGGYAGVVGAACFARSGARFSR